MGTGLLIMATMLVFVLVGILVVAMFGNGTKSATFDEFDDEYWEDDDWW